MKKYNTETYNIYHVGEDETAVSGLLGMLWKNAQKKVIFYISCSTIDRKCMMYISNVANYNEIGVYNK